MDDHQDRSPWIATAAQGAAAGAIATLAMSAVMLAAGAIGLMGTQPPHAIVRRIGGLPSRLPWRRDRTRAIASLAHVGFGAACGTGFAVARRATPATNAPGTGVLYALAIWATAYLGWVPALGILPRADRDRPGRPAAMIVAHVVYGLVLGALTRRRRLG